MPSASAVTAPIEFLIFPYAAAAGRSLLHVLIDELRSGRWDQFQAAVAFAKTSGNYPALLQAMEDFAAQGGTINLTFGADAFGGESRGSDYECVEQLLQAFKDIPSFKLHLYHERGRTFHPKVYLFSHETEKRATLILGSSNWSAGGFFANVEANVVIRFNLKKADQRRAYDELRRCFADFWEES